ncbi:hypothetical protein Ahy_A09g045628 [Arachis hypogaea]|uniref:Uncharacterized protein n=1 Tax=Arachis hypogaea TaxID=3818 RepID=A0A445BMU1_ARAHY|nr:hypothetical protein Ahy_A09g045628 [Arachis hypogaea]
MSNPSVTEIYIGTIEQEGKEATHTHQEQPQRATLGAKKQEELTAILHCAYDNLMVEMEELKAKRKGTCSLSHEDANLESVNELQSPPRIANASKKKKTKALNELNLFDAASEMHSNFSQYQGHVMNYQFRKPVGLGFRGLGIQHQGIEVWPPIATNGLNSKRDAVRAIIISAAASSGVGLLRDDISYVKIYTQGFVQFLAQELSGTERDKLESEL